MSVNQREFLKYIDRSKVSFDDVVKQNSSFRTQETNEEKRKDEKEKLSEEKKSFH